MRHATALPRGVRPLPGGDMRTLAIIVAVVRTTGGEALGDGGTVVAATALSGSEALGDEGSNVAVVVLAGDYALDPP